MLQQRFVLGDKSDITVRLISPEKKLHKYVQDNSTKEALIDDYNLACYSTKEVIGQNFGGLLAFTAQTFWQEKYCILQD